MFEYNGVYAAVKKYCSAEEQDPGEDCFATIARDAKVPASYLEYVLNSLQEKGLIIYSFEDKVIYLTQKGRLVERI